jgi:3-phenylpropionate/cinnamic acid dioxygenase small subunit
MEMTPDQIRDLLEVKEKMDVLELQYKYVRSVDERDWGTSAELFHEGAKLYVTDSGQKRLIGGKPEIETFFREIAARDFIFARHFITNPVVRIDGQQAFFTSYYNTMFIHDNFTKVIFGFYDDHLSKVDGQWRFTEKNIIMGWNDFLVPMKDFRRAG